MVVGRDRNTCGASLSLFGNIPWCFWGRVWLHNLTQCMYFWHVHSCTLLWFNVSFLSPCSFVMAGTFKNNWAGTWFKQILGFAAHGIYLFFPHAEIRSLFFFSFNLFIRYYARGDAENAMRYINGTRLDDRIIRTDWDAGFKEGRQYGRGRSGGQVGCCTVQFLKDWWLCWIIAIWINALRTT